MRTLTCFRMPKYQKINSAAPPRWISPYIKPGSKRFLSWDKCRGLNFALEVGPFCVVSLVTLQNRSFEQLATISARLSFTRLLDFLGSKCLVMFKFDHLYIATIFCKITQKITQKILAPSDMIKGATSEISLDCGRFLAKLPLSFVRKFIFQSHSDKSGKQIYKTIPELIDKPSVGLKIILNVSYTDQFGCFNQTLCSLRF